MGAWRQRLPAEDAPARLAEEEKSKKTAKTLRKRKAEETGGRMEAQKPAADEATRTEAENAEAEHRSAAMAENWVAEAGRAPLEPPDG